MTNDSESIITARSELTHPRTRLSAEIAWLPGVSPKRATDCLGLVSDTPDRVFELDSLPPLALANLMAAALESIRIDRAQPWAPWLRRFADVVERIDTEAVQRDVNEDRTVAGLPQISAIEWIEAELSERRRIYKNAVRAWLDGFPPEALLAIVVAATEAATDNGKQHPPRLIEDVVADFELSAQPALAKAQKLISDLVEHIRAGAQQGKSAVNPVIDRLEMLAKQWDSLAQPMQLCANSRGEAYSPSQRIAYQIRGLAVDLANNHQLFEISKRLTLVLQEAFGEVPDVAERTTEDAAAIQGLLDTQRKAEADRATFGHEISYSADIGLFVSKRLAISSRGIEWGKQRFALESISRFRWGAVRRSVNFIPVGTDFHIAFGDEKDIALVHTNQEAVYNAFIERLWRVACGQIMRRYAEGLRASKSFRFGDIVVSDEGCEVISHKLIGSERIRAPWSDLQIWSSNGSFVVGIKGKKEAYAAASYKDVNNTHALEQMIRVFFKDPKTWRLSGAILD